MRRLKLLRVAGAVAVLALGMDDRSIAGDIEIPISRNATITDGGETRFLFHIDIPDSLMGQRILYASCEINLLLDSCKGKPPSFLAAPLMKDWSSTSVSWSTGWDSAGADYALAGSADVAVAPGPPAVASFSVGEWLRAVTRGRTNNFGFILIPVGDDDSFCRRVVVSPSDPGHIVVKF